MQSISEQTSNKLLKEQIPHLKCQIYLLNESHAFKTRPEPGIQFHAHIHIQKDNLICSWNPEVPVVIQCVTKPSLLRRP